MIWLVLLGVICSGLCLLVYGIYLIAVLRAEKYIPSDELSQYVPLSILIPARNEEAVIDKKIKNLVEIDYPSELLQVVVVDDASTDQTRSIAICALDKYHLDGVVITNDIRRGTNYCYNKGMSQVRNDLVITTDADVWLEDQALKKIVAVLINEEGVGAACGELVPVIDEQSISTSVEKPYRDVYGKMCAWESRLHSTYCFNGPLIALKRKAYQEMNPLKGASDTNMALGVIRNGYEAKYVSSAKFYEWIPTNLGQQKKQKIRRATRLLEATWSARDLLFKKDYGLFGLVVLPLRMIMFLVVPLGCAVSIITWGLVIFSGSGIEWTFFYFLMILIILGLGVYCTNLVSSFLWHQYYLLSGLVNMIKPMHLWESVDRSSIKG